MSHLTITTQAELLQYVEGLAGARVIAYDTEFVAEDTFRPQLCLVQVCTEQGAALIDPLEVGDLRPFWEVVVNGDHQTIVHAGRGEVEFCLLATGRAPVRLFDVQLAAGFIGLEYPAGYSNLIAKLLGQHPKKHETRTDWRRRPLTHRQIEYALEDVRYLLPLQEILQARLAERQRLEWLATETANWLGEVQAGLTEERWWRVSGNASLGGRGLAIVRELWRWRQAEAERRNKPPRRILRDDLIVEMARRQTADLKQVRAVRGMEWSNVRQHLPEIVRCIERGLASPELEIRQPGYRDTPPQLSVLGQFLSAALGSICRQAELAASLVGTASDVRDLILYELEPESWAQPPLLATGWRSQVVGALFEDVLAGRLSIRVGDPHSDYPLVIDRPSPE